MKKLYILNHTDNPTPSYTGGIGHSNAIDLYTAEEVRIKAGEFKYIDMGVSIKVPDGYKADLKPRSSTFKNFGIIQANSIGLLDSKFSGVTDRVMFPAFVPINQDDIKYMFADFVVKVISGEYNTTGKSNEELIMALLPESSREVVIPKGTRICQLEILPCSDIEEIEELSIEEWNFEDRGGLGSTGV